MAFINVLFPVDISYGATGGVGYKTEVVPMASGFEQRSSIWAQGKGVWDVSHGIKTQAQLDILIAFFRNMKGRFNSFRFKDWSDFTVTTGQGIFTTIDATHFQMQRRYTTSGNNSDRKITKPVSGTIIVTGGTGVSIDYTTGIVTVSSGTPTAWTGEFDVHCRFDTDQMKVSLTAFNIYSWGNIPVVEEKT